MPNPIDNNLIQLLGQAMSDVSEDCYCAGWTGATADIVPELCRRAIESGVPQSWGHGEVTPAKANQLADLARRAGAWADLHPQDDSYIAYQPFPVAPEVAEDIDREQRVARRRSGGAG